MSFFDDIITHLESSGDHAVKAILNALRLPDVVREGIGNVLLAGVSTNAAAVASARIRFAIQVERRRPFVSPQDICKAARKAADEALGYVPYVITVQALFGDPIVMIALGQVNAVSSTENEAAALAKATAILVLLAPPLRFTDLDTFLNDLNQLLGGFGGPAKGLYDEVKDLLDQPEFLSGKPISGSTRSDLDALVRALEQFQVAQGSGFWSGVTKLFNAAARGTRRITDAVYAQEAALCGTSGPPARAFFERREDTISLDRTYPSITAGHGSWALLVDRDKQSLFSVKATDEQSRSEFGLSGKTTALTLALASKVQLKEFAYKVRELTIFAESEEVEIAERPLVDVVAGNTILLEQRTKDLLPNCPIAVSGRQDTGAPVPGPRVTEVAFLASADTIVENRTLLRLKSSLRFTYVRDTVQVNANVARVSHGESIREVLGSGDASVRHQEFALKQAPLTYVGANNDSARVSTLAVHVNDMRWSEVATLVGREPHERVFVTDADDEGRTRVQFGDGVEGAVAASGYNNVRAEYRRGVGEPGNVGAGTVTTLLTRPLGVTSVVNPEAATGGENIEPIDNMRRNAPMTVRTFNRAVSLTDYEDYAVTRPGIAKALAIWISSGGARGIHLTVAGPRGAAVDDSTLSKVFANLRTFGDPLIPLEIRTYQPVTFHVKARLTLAADVTPGTVTDQVTAALRRDFGFDARPFADAISLDDVMATIHTVTGVIAVDVDAFYRHGQSEQLNATLVARGSELQSDNSVTAAELLSLDEAQIDLTLVPIKGVA